jgi:hypothetical protein
LRVFPDDLNGVVHAAAIENEILEIWITLQENRPDGFLDEPSLVEGRCNYSDSRTRMGLRLITQAQAFFRPWPTPPARRWWREFS